MLEPLRADLRLSYAQAGLLLAALPAGGLVGNAFGVAADFVDRRRLASLGAFVYGLCLLTFATADAFPVLLTAAFVWGAASDAFVHGCEIALVDLARDRLAGVLGRVNALGAVGDLLGPLTLVAAAAVGLSWRGAFALGGLLMLAYALWLALQRFPRPRPGQAPLAGLLAVARDRRVLLLALADLLFGLLDEPFLGFTIAYLERVRSLAPGLALTVITVSVAAGIVGFLAVGPVTGWLGDRRTLWASISAVAVGVVLLIAAPALQLLLAAAFAFGLAGAVFYAVLQAAYLGLRPGQAGTTGAVIGTLGLAGIGMPVLVGGVSDALGLTAGLGLYAAVPLLILGLLALLRGSPR